MAEHTGDLKEMFPPGNNGTEVGTGKIVSERIFYDFVTPTANNDQELTLEKPVSFTLDDEGVVTNVVQEG